MTTRSQEPRPARPLDVPRHRTQSPTPAPDESAPSAARPIVTPVIDPDLAERVKLAYATDPELDEIRAHLRNPVLPLAYDTVRLLRDHSLDPELDVVLLKGRIRVPNDPQLRLDIVSSCHDTPLAGHQGRTRTHASLRRSFVWPHDADSVQAYVEGCEACSASRAAQGLPPVSTASSTSSTPWRRISMVSVTKLPPSHKYDSIQLFIDRASEMTIAVPYTEEGFDARKLARKLARMYIDHVVAHHGLQIDVLSDRGTTFTLSFLTSLVSLLGARPHILPTFHPQGNGQTRRTDQSVETYLWLFCDLTPADWPRHLPTCTFALNNAQSSATASSPFFASFGHHPIAPSDFLLTDLSKNPAANAEIGALARLHKVLHESLLRTQEWMSTFESRARSRAPRLDDDGNELPLFKVEDKVHLSSANLATSRPTFKLGQRALGPFPIKRQVSAVAYELDLPPTFHLHPIFHVAQLDSAPNTVADPVAPPAIVDDEGQQVFVPERILDHKHTVRGTSYLVHWEGYDASEDTWEPASGVKGLRVLKEYLAATPSGKVPRRRT